MMTNERDSKHEEPLIQECSAMWQLGDASFATDGATFVFTFRSDSCRQSLIRGTAAI